jgi:hypothetical protein
MTDRSRRLPPPPPPEVTRPDSQLPALRPRRVDSFGSRNDQSRRAVQLPEPPKEWLRDSGRAVTKSGLPLPPEPPEILSEVLQDMADKYALPVSEKAAPSGGGEAFDARQRINIPVICTKTDRAFILIFREPRCLECKYKLETTLTDVETGTVGQSEASLTVPIDKVDWSGITCPHCRNRVQPIQCGGCKRLACDGRVTQSSNGTFFQCAASCGCSGWLSSNLRNVTGSQGWSSAASGPAHLSGRSPASPSGSLPRLPKLK